MQDRPQQGVLNVKAAAHIVLASLLIAGFLLPAMSSAQAPTRSAGVPGTVVAVVDISAIFEKHAGFKGAMERMRQDFQQYESELRARHEALSKERDEMLQYSPGSPEYEQRERVLADKAAKLQVDTQLKKKEFLQRESKIYYQVYQEISNAVREFAELKGIDLVLRYNSEEMQPDDRNSVLQGVNRALVFQRNLDITREILDRLNRTPRVSNRQAAPARTPQATPAPRRR